MVIDKKILELMNDAPLLKVEADAPIREAANLMKEHRRGAILIEDKGSLRGIFTERDMVFRVVAAGLDPQTTPISRVMSTELVVGHPQDSHVIGLRRMASAGVRHLPIVEDSKVIGVVSRRQLMAVDIELMDAEIDRREACRLFI